MSVNMPDNSYAHDVTNRGQGFLCTSNCTEAHTDTALCKCACEGRNHGIDLLAYARYREYIRSESESLRASLSEHKGD